MSSLWTPSGEHRVPRDGGSGAGGGAPPASDGGGEGSSDGGPGQDGAAAGALDEPGIDASAIDEETRERLEELRAQILAAPAEDVVANHAFGLFELAAMHLSAERPALAAARLAIDALGALVEGLGDRLGGHAGPLRDGLSQIRLAFVKISQTAAAGDGAPDPPADPEGGGPPGGPPG